MNFEITLQRRKGVHEKEFDCPRCQAELCRASDTHCYICGFLFPTPDDTDTENENDFFNPSEVH